MRHYALLAIFTCLAFVDSVQAQAPAALTFDKIVEYLDLGVSEAKLVKLIEQSPTHFVLDDRQINRLKTAGASESVLQAIANHSAKPTQASDVTEFVLILDCSGSMNDQLSDGQSKWESAKKGAQELTASIPLGRKLAVIVYGTDKERQCQSVDVLRPLNTLTSDDDKEAIARRIASLKAVGHTPISRALQLAGHELESASGMSSVILITDGMETCHGDPVSEAAALVGKHPNLEGIHVVGYCLGDAEVGKVAAIAKAGHGDYHDSKNAQELAATIRKIEEDVVKADPTDEVDLSSLTPLERLLCEQLSDESLSVREQSAKAINERRLKAAAPFLIKMMVEAEWLVGTFNDDDRDAALDALLVVAPERVPAAMEAVLMHSPHFGARTWAAQRIGDKDIQDAKEALKKRLLTMKDADISPNAINGYDELNALFSSLRKIASEEVEETMIALSRDKSASKKAWALKKLGEL